MNVQKPFPLKSGDLVWCVLCESRPTRVRHWLPQLTLEHHVVRKCRIVEVHNYTTAWVNSVPPLIAGSRLISVDNIFVDKGAALNRAKFYNDQLTSRLIKNLREMNQALNALSDEVFRHIGKIS